MRMPPLVFKSLLVTLAGSTLLPAQPLLLPAPSQSPSSPGYEQNTYEPMPSPRTFPQARFPQESPLPGAYDSEPLSRYRSYYAPPMETERLPESEWREIEGAGPEITEYQMIEPYAPVSYGPPIELYPHVNYLNERCVPHTAVPYLVEVKLRQPRRRRGCVDCGPSCALVKICVPPCGTPRIRVRRRGFRTTYDFGKFEVTVFVRRNNCVVVSYS